ncbi:MAG: hypothetical protein FD167_410 [bacterium]|nr:MAG: hypothetical protein FD167_410 [bacterium]
MKRYVLLAVIILLIGISSYAYFIVKPQKQSANLCRQAAAITFENYKNTVETEIAFSNNFNRGNTPRKISNDSFEYPDHTFKKAAFKEPRHVFKNSNNCFVEFAYTITRYGTLVDKRSSVTILDTNTNQSIGEIIRSSIGNRSDYTTYTGFLDGQAIILDSNLANKSDAQKTKAIKEIFLKKEAEIFGNNDYTLPFEES